MSETIERTETMPDDARAIETLPAVSSDASSLMAVISRAASDPATDVVKLEKLLDMYERIQARQAKVAYAAALAELQPELPIIGERGGIKDKNDRVQSTYALWEDINEGIRPVLAKHGFSLTFRTGFAENLIVVTGVLTHRDGHSEETSLRLPADTTGSKNTVQAIASSVSYGKRYTGGALLNFTSRGEDDDGVMAGARLITDAQRDSLNILADTAGADKRAFCTFMGVDSIAAIPARDYKKAEQALQAKAAATAKAGAAA